MFAHEIVLLGELHLAHTRLIVVATVTAVIVSHGLFGAQLRTLLLEENLGPLMVARDLCDPHVPTLTPDTGLGEALTSSPIPTVRSRRVTRWCWPAPRSASASRRRREAYDSTSTPRQNAT